MIRGILFDLDGVFYVGEQVIDGAVATLDRVRQQGIPHLFLTNTTSRPRSAIVEKLSGMGIDIDPATILTPPVAASRWISEHVDGPLALFIPEATQSEFSAFEQLAEEENQGAGAVVLGDMGHAWTFDRLNRAFRLLMQEPVSPLVALGMTRFWRSEEGLQLDTGPFVKALEYATGREAVVMGKPAKAFFDAALSMLGCEPSECLMIGDDIRGDVAGAQASGIRAALVRTGKFSKSDLGTGIAPDLLLDSICDLPAWWENRESLKP
ncbi:MAG: TIGR01458 family HAD-type hydrolase [Chromatiales bacterium]|jgi:HAD superfamily hydrolase (TIGR01458 family)